MSSHVLQHSFAMHLLEVGYDIRTARGFRGDGDMNITMIYTHVLNRGGRAARIPLDVI